MLHSYEVPVVEKLLPVVEFCYRTWYRICFVFGRRGGVRGCGGRKREPTYVRVRHYFIHAEKTQQHHNHHNHLRQIRLEILVQRTGTWGACTCLWYLVRIYRTWYLLYSRTGTHTVGRQSVQHDSTQYCASTVPTVLVCSTGRPPLPPPLFGHRFFAHSVGEMM